MSDSLGAWQTVTLDSLLPSGGIFDGPFGSNLKTSDYTEAGVRVIRLENLANLRFIDEKRTYISKEKYETLRKHTVGEGDILFGSFIDGLPRVCVLPRLDTAAIAKADCFTLRPDENVDRKFLAYQLGTQAVRDALIEQIHGATRPRITTKQLRALTVALPPLPEQRRIVEKVEALLARVNAARDRLTKLPTILKRFRQSILAAACSGRLTEDWRRTNRGVWRETLDNAPSNDLPSATEHLEDVEFPESWRMVRVDALVSIQNGRAFPSREYQDSGVRLLRPGNLNVDGEVEWTLGNTASLPMSWAIDFPEFVLGDGELVMNLTAQSLKDEFLGRVCMKRDAQPALLNQRIARFNPLTKHDCRPYLSHYFRSTYFRSFVNGLDTGSLIRHMHSKDVARTVVPLPPPDEQKEICRRVEMLLGLATLVGERGIVGERKAVRLHESMLAHAFSGVL